jgi:hypothetical protein
MEVQGRFTEPLIYTNGRDYSIEAAMPVTCPSKHVRCIE